MSDGSNDHARLLPRLPSAPLVPKTKEEIEEDERQFELIKKKLAEKKKVEGSGASASAASAYAPNESPVSFKTLPRLPSDLPPPKSPHEIEQEAAEFERMKGIKTSSPTARISSSFRNALHHLPRLPSSLPPIKTDEEIAKEEAEFDRVKGSTIMHSHSPMNRISMNFRHMVSGLPRLPSSEPYHIPKEELEREAAEFEKEKVHFEELENSETKAIQEEEKNSKIRAQQEEKERQEEEEELKKLGVKTTDTSCCGSLKKRLVRFKRGFAREVRERHALERLMLCAVAVALVWLTSLRISRDIVGTFIIGPELDYVVDSAKIAADRTTEERERYLSCSNRRVDQCNQTFLRELNDEVERVRLVMESNRAALDSYDEMRQNASENFGFTITILDYLQNTLNDDIRDYGTVEWDTNPICDQVKDLVKEQSAAKEASKDAGTFKSKADAAVEDLLAQMQAREDYDRNYLANKLGQLKGIGLDLDNYVEDPDAIFAKLGASRDKLIACTTSVTGVYNGQTCNGQSLAKRVDNYKNYVVSTYDDAYDSVSTMINNVRSDFSDLKNFYDKFTAEVKKYSGLITAISNALPSGVTFIDLQYSSSLDTNLPTFSSLNFQSVGSVNTNFNIAPINTNMNTDVSGISDALAEQKNNAIANANYIRERNKAWQDEFFEGYNPPPVGVNSTRESWYSRSDRFLPDVGKNLGLLSSRVETPDRPDVEITANSTSSALTASQLISTLDPRDIELYVYDDISIPDIMKDFRNIEFLALNFDYIYRVLRSIQLIRKYWTISEIATPPADVREKANRGAKLSQSSFKTPLQVIGNIITHPIVLYTLFVVVLSMITGAFLALYLPIYYAYTSGCVQNSYLDQGTVITRNANTLAFNYGASAGDSVADSEIDRQNVVRELECDKHTQKTYDVLIQNLDEYKFLLRKRNEIRDINVAFQVCVDTLLVDSTYPTIASDATFGNASSMHETVFHPSFNSTFASLDPSLFDCSSISLCQVECTGPNEITIQSSTFNAGCNVEWYLHANILGFFLSLLVFVLLNVSRGIFMRGLVHVLWRNIAIPKFSYIGSCYETGQIIFPYAVTHEGKTMKEAIREALKISLRSLVRMGYLLLLAAAALNLPWIVLLYMLSQDLVFIPVE